jgi:hypothetical protein
MNIFDKLFNNIGENIIKVVIAFSAIPSNLLYPR